MKYRIALVGILFLLLGFRWLVPERGYEDLGLVAVFNTVFALGLASLIVVMAGCVGFKFHKRLHFNGLPTFEQLLFVETLGLGVIAYLITALALLGQLSVLAIVLLLTAVALLTGDELPGLVLKSKSILLAAWPKTPDPIQKIQIAIIIGLFGLALIQALSTPWGSDSLMYHLDGPKQFLSVGGFIPLPNMWQANGPFTVDMLYTIGLAFNTDVFARLIHWIFGLLFVAGTFGLGFRVVGSKRGWDAGIILLGIPILLIWFSLAYHDAGWALFELMGLYTLVIWRDKGARSWIVLAGLMMGFAIGSKYLALGGVAALGAFILIRRGRSLKEILKDALLFGLVTVFVGGFWYLKNWLLLGNPVFPAYFGGLGWDAARLELYNQYHRAGFGTGSSWIDYLLLPINLYAQFQSFGTFLGSIEIPSFLFLLVLLYPFLRKKDPLVTALGVVTLIRFGFWAVGSQQVRFLLPMFPVLAIISAVVLNAAAGRIKAPYGSVLTRGLLTGLLVVTLAYQVIFFLQVRPLGVIVGRETRGEFLSRVGSNYASMKYLNEALPVGSRALVIHDGRGYYCSEAVS